MGLVSCYLFLTMRGSVSAFQEICFNDQIHFLVLSSLNLRPRYYEMFELLVSESCEK